MKEFFSKCDQIRRKLLQMKSLMENFIFCVQGMGHRTLLAAQTKVNNNNKVSQIMYFFLTLPAPCISESYIEIKINLNFYFQICLWCLK